jgi:hypothetical protein
MPLDTRVQEYVRALAAEHSVSLADARRMLVEQIDHAKRSHQVKGITMPEKGHGRLQLPNPFRRHIDPTPPETQEPAQRKSVKSPGTPKRESPETEKMPIPGSLTAIIWGALKNPEKDFIGSFQALRSTHRFDDLTDDELMTWMRKVAWNYEIPIRAGV